MSKLLEVFPIGSEVLLDSGVVTAQITAIFIRRNFVTYEATWWNDRDRKVEVVEESEIRCQGEKQCVSPIL